MRTTMQIKQILSVVTAVVLLVFGCAAPVDAAVLTDPTDTYTTTTTEDPMPTVERYDAGNTLAASDTPLVTTTTAPATTTVTTATAGTTVTTSDAGDVAGLFPQIALNSAKGYRGDVVKVPIRIANNPGFNRLVVQVAWEDGGVLQPVMDFDDPKFTAESVGRALQFAAVTENNYYRFYTISENFCNEDGWLLSCYFQIPADAPLGNYPVKLTVRELSGNNEAFDCVATSAVVTVLEDMVTQPPTPPASSLGINDAICGRKALDEKYDVNGDGVINAFDTVALKRMVLSEGEQLAAKVKMDGVIAHPGEIVPMSIRITGNPGFRSVLFTVVFPEDGTLIPVLEGGELQFTENAANGNVRFGSTGSDRRFALFTVSDAVCASDGVLVTFYLRVADNACEGRYGISLSADSLVTENGKSLCLGVGGTVQVEKNTAVTTLPTLITTTTTQYTDIRPDAQYHGIDVSRWQGTVDWKKVKAAKIDFAILRAGYGREAEQVDPTFLTNLKNAQAQGIACGAYWYSYAKTVDEAKLEAALFLKTVKGQKFEFPLVFDIEEPDQQALGKDAVSAIIDAFCSTVQKSGYYCVLYSYASFLNYFVTDAVLQKYDIWVAHTGTAKPAFTGDYGMWQYSHNGAVDGIAGRVDMNYAYRDYPAIMLKKHYNGF